VWSSDLDGNGLREEVAYPTAPFNNALGAITTYGDGVLVWVPGPGYFPQTLSPYARSELVACTPTCSTIGDGPTTPWKITAASGMIVAYTRSQVFVSRDAGVTFSALPLPNGVISSVAIVAGQPWVAMSTGSFAIMNGTINIALGDVSQHPSLSLISLGGHIVMDALQDAGYRCIGRDMRWLPRCPSA
jgi:hypothetical protein